MPKTLHPLRAAAVSLLMVNAFAMPVYAAPATETAPQVSLKTSVLTNAQTLADTTSKSSKKAWRYMNTELPQSSKTYEMRRKAKRVTSPVTQAVNGGFKLTDAKMSRPFMLLILTFVMGLGLLGMSKATARTGGHH